MWRGLALVAWVTVAGATELRLARPVLPLAIAGQHYTQGPMAVESGGRCPLGTATTRLVDGALPEGMSMDGAGYLRGTPVRPGVYGFSVEMRTGCGRAVERAELEVAVAPMLSVSLAKLDFSCERGGRPPAPQRVMVSGTQPGLPYTMAAKGAAWLEIRPKRGMLPPKGSALTMDSVDLLVHPEKLDSGEYHATLLTYAWGGAAPASTEVHLQVKSAGSSWDNVRTVPMMTMPVAPPPMIITVPAYIEPPPPPKPKPLVLAPKPAPVKRPGFPVTRSRIVAIPRITLPEASKEASKILGPVEVMEPPKKPKPKENSSAH